MATGAAYTNATTIDLAPPAGSVSAGEDSAMRVSAPVGPYNMKQTCRSAWVLPGLVTLH